MMRVITAAAVVAFCSCAHCPPPRPAPSPEVVRVEVPVQIPCPAPSEQLEYKPILLQYDTQTTDIDSLLLVWVRDTVELARSQHEALEKLKVYSKKD